MSHRPSRATCWQKKFIKRSSLGGDQLRLHKVVESSLKTTPGGTERVRDNDFFEQASRKRLYVQFASGNSYLKDARKAERHSPALRHRVFSCYPTN